MGLTVSTAELMGGSSTGFVPKSRSVVVDMNLFFCLSAYAPGGIGKLKHYPYSIGGSIKMESAPPYSGFEACLSPGSYGWRRKKPRKGQENPLPVMLLSPTPMLLTVMLLPYY